MGDGLLFLDFSRIELFPINQEVVKDSLKTSVQTCDANHSMHGRGEQLRKTKCSTVECFRPVALAAGRSRADAMCISGILLATIDKVGKTCGQICALSRTRWCRTAGWLSPIAPSLLHLTASYWFPRAPASVCVSSEEREYSTQTHTRSWHLKLTQFTRRAEWTSFHVRHFIFLSAPWYGVLDNTWHDYFTDSFRLKNSFF